MVECGGRRQLIDKLGCVCVSKRRQDFFSKSGCGYGMVWGV
jgi:hypothetical protein